MNVGDWFDTRYSSKAHRLSSDREDGICGFPLVVGGSTEGLKPNTTISKRCSVCKREDVDYLRPKRPSPVVGDTSGDVEEWLRRTEASNTRAAPVDARGQFARRQFEAIAMRVQSAFHGSEWAVW